MSIRKGYVETALAKITAKIAEVDPMCEWGLDDGNILQELAHCQPVGRLIRPAQNFSDNEGRYKDRNVPKQLL